MAKFITLLTFTQKGAENIIESPMRLDAAKEAFAKAGAEIEAFYMVLGKCDAVVISDAPDSTTALKLALSNTSQGNVRGQTLRAFTEEEYRQVISEIS